MAQWQFNRPPNWPASVTEPALDWRPDPAWGPPPVGWELWQRRRPSLFGPRAVAVASAAAALLSVATVQLISAQPQRPAPGEPANLVGQPGGSAAISDDVRLGDRSDLSGLEQLTAAKGAAHPISPADLPAAH